MRILFLTDDFSGASLCARLAREGNDVRAHVGNKTYIETLNGLVEKIPSIEGGLNWVGKDGLIVCDDNGFGPLQDTLRLDGFSVVGGSAGGDLLEDDREHAQKVFAAHGLKSIPTHTFDSAMTAAAFVEKNPTEWVLKRNGHSDKTACYVGKLTDARDVINLLDLAGRRNGGQPTKYVINKPFHGIEKGVARYFNGTDWVGPIELNIEHKKFFPGDLGPKTAEMGTLMWYTDDESKRLYRETLDLLTPYLKQVGFRGDIDINCIVTEEGAWPLEATTRFGYPAVQAQMALHKSPWGNFLKAVADGEKYDLDWHPGYAVVVLVAVPPFPFCSTSCQCSDDPRGLEIHFRNEPSSDDWQHLHFEGVSIVPINNASSRFTVIDQTGYVMHVTGLGNTANEARQQVHERVANIIIPRMYYRNDIGEAYIRLLDNQLRDWGWL